MAKSSEGTLDFEVILALKVTAERINAESDQLMLRVEEESGCKIADLAGEEERAEK